MLNDCCQGNPGFPQALWFCGASFIQCIKAVLLNHRKVVGRRVFQQWKGLPAADIDGA